jgi:pyruvate dehydrogenase E2 component (dihydrolipoamide acetyltransferase)
MKIALTLPQLGLTQTEGTVSAWLKKTGDAVKKDEIVYVVETDKADMEIEAPADGTIGEILVGTGITVPVGTPLAYLITEGAEVSAPDSSRPVEAEVAAAAVPAPPVQPAAGKEVDRSEKDRDSKASPLARRIARDASLDLATVQGTGPRGRIVAADVRAALSAADQVRVVEKAPAAASIAAEKAAPPSGDLRRRQLIADRMIESVRSIPCFTVTSEVNAAKLMDLYESVKGQFAPAAKVTYTDLLLKALALALKQAPAVNASWVEGAPRPFESINLNIAVATDRGVVAPIIRNVDQLSLEHLAQARAGVAERARLGRLSLAEVENGSGTLSNLGMYRVDNFEGIITPGQCFIVSVGKLKGRPWVEGTTLSIQPTLYVTVSVDHRIADGAQAAGFLERIAEAIEKPYTLLLR